MNQIQNFFNKHKKANVSLMTGVLIGAYLGKFTQVPLIFTFGMLAVTFLGGVPLLLRALSALRFKIIAIELLVSLAVISALFVGEYSEAGLVVWLFSLGDLLEELTLAKTRNSIKELSELAPKTAWQIVGPKPNDLIEVELAEVEQGAHLLVKAGSQVPVDGVVLKGEGHVDEASITGESKPKHKQQKSEVFAGTLLQSGTLVVEAKKIGEDTTFGKLIELVEEAQDSQTPTQRMIDRFSQYYTPVVLVLALSVGLITKDLRLATTLLVLGCPGALVIGVPVSTVAGIGRAAQQGIIVKGSAVLDELTKIDTFVFDKTGTLTTGEPTVGQIQYFTKEQAEALKLLASIEHESDHPLAKAVLKYYSQTEFYPVTKSEIVTGRGIKARVAGQTVLVGSERLLNEAGIKTTAVKLPKTSSHVLVAVAGKLVLALEVKDPLRADVPKTLARLKKKTRAQFFLLSGDAQIVAQNTVSNLDFAKVQGELLPTAKANYIKKLQVAGHKVAFIGDGINDSPALAQADLGIAMGSGTEVAIETSDIVLVQSRFAKLALAVKYAKKTRNNMAQNIGIALLTVVLLFIGLFTGHIYMTSGMLIHELSILVVILNGMRLLKM